MRLSSIRRRLPVETLAPLLVAALLVTVGIANLLWDAGVPNQASPVRMSPQTDPFPVFPFSGTLHVLPVPASTNQSTRLTLLSIQGLVNRGGAQLYLDFNNETGNASSMLSFLVSQYGVPFDVVSLDWVYTHYLPARGGIIIIDPSRPESVNIATMLAALQGGVLAGPDNALFLERTYGLRILLDYGSSNWSSADPAATYDRARAELLPQMSRDLLAILPPDRLPLRDYLIATRTFVFYEPQGVLASPAELASTQRVLAAAHRGIPILGWFDSPTLTEENAFIQLASEYGKPVFGTQDVPNLSVLTAFGRNQIRAQPAPPAAPPLANKTYVVMAVPDGDNLDFIAHRMPELWAEPERGTFPIAWSLSPLLADLAPPYLDYYYRTATPDDRFVLGPSGAGYLYPDYLGTGDLAPYLEFTSRYANRTGMDVAWLLNAFVASEIPYAPATLSAYVDALHPRGLVLDYDDQAKTQEAWMQGGSTSAAPAIRSTQLWTTFDNFYAKVDAAMATWDSGPHFLWVTVYTFRFDLADAKSVIAGLTARTRGNLVVVTPEQLFTLMEEDFQARAAAQLASMQADPFASTLLAPALHSAQGWLTAPNPQADPGIAAYHAYLASTDLRDAGLEEAVTACALVLVLAALVALRHPLTKPATVRDTLREAHPLPVIGAVVALFFLALRSGLAANFWSYQWIVAGVILAGVGRPFRRYLDRTYPRFSLPATVALDLVFVTLGLGTNVAFPLVAIGTVSMLDTVLVRHPVRPSALILALSLGSAAGFLADVSLVSMGLLAVVMIVPLLVEPLPPPHDIEAPSRGASLRGFVLVLPLGALVVATNFSIGLRLGLAGEQLPTIAGVFLALGPLTGLLAVRRWAGGPTRRVQGLAFALAALLAATTVFTRGAAATALLLLATTAALAIAAEATLRIEAQGGRVSPAAVASAVSWIPLFLIFFRMPPVVYSLTVVRLPQPVETLLYVPQFVLAAVASIFAMAIFVRHRATIWPRRI